MKVPESISVCSGAGGEEINCHSENTFLKCFATWIQSDYTFPIMPNILAHLNNSLLHMPTLKSYFPMLIKYKEDSLKWYSDF